MNAKATLQLTPDGRPERRKIPPEGPHVTYRITSPMQPYDLDGIMKTFGLRMAAAIAAGRLVGFQGFDSKNLNTED